MNTQTKLAVLEAIRLARSTTILAFEFEKRIVALIADDEEKEIKALEELRKTAQQLMVHGLVANNGAEKTLKSVSNLLALESAIETEQTTE